ncbi:ADP-ribosylglycohydrolase family protein [Nostoc parmelioides]|uniref:ADP-ribosylglycohydrolase family protein n=1 Tax=Nostoc parmelioides FACHB-3921 TaxID=2692909 RepID=A0ABR8BMC0_9NOSO|nr:ADP-ribosylglycohydrolase family protein [Nostoc parmelioides]MBD2253961.1 ADP-ribosylglycohydrolase family protein [Nostoc parmelioides FACHB-3921]
MRYSLVSRFRGAFVGGILGENLAKGGVGNNRESFSNFAKTIIPGAESLIKLGKLDVDEWLVHYQKEFIASTATLDIKTNLIFATIPVALFFHENPVKLHQNLVRVSNVWDNASVVRDSTLAIGYAIAQSLTEKLHIRTIIPQIISFIGETETLLPQKLLIIHKLLAEHAGLERLKAELSREEKLSHATAVAFYCFLSTLEDFRFSVLRSLQIESMHSQTITAITGVLSGGYNSTVGIPANWQTSLLPTNSAANEATNLWQMLELADALAAVWSGVYNFPLNSREFPESGFIMPNQSVPFSVYAAPHIIRGR